MNKQLQVLLIEDSEDDALLLRRELARAGYEPVINRVESAAALLAALKAQAWDAVISDYQLPRFTGMDALKLVQAHGGDMPFIMISGVIGEEQAVAVMKAGAHDFLLKDNLARLVPTLERELSDADERRWRREAQAALRASEQRYRTLAVATFEGIVITEQGRIVDANEQLARMMGYQVHELKGREVAALIPPEDLARVLAKIQAGQESQVEHELLRKDGTRRIVEAHGQTVSIDGREVRFTALRDITERKQTERALEYAHEELRATAEALQEANATLEHRVAERTAQLQGTNELLQRALRGWRALSAGNEALLRAQNETEFLERICRVIVEIGGYRMAWVGFAEHDAQKRVRPVAQAGFEKGYLDRARVTWADTPRGRGPTGTAVRTGRPSVCHSIAKDPRLEPWRKQAQQQGYASSVALPLRDGDQCLGALTIYATEAGAFMREELALLTELADDMVFGIKTLRLRAERARLEQQILEISEREQRRIGQDIHDGLGQEIAALGYMVSFLQSQLADKQYAEAADAKRICGHLQRVLQQVRSVSRSLHPVKSEPDGLMVALEQLAAHIAQSFKVSCQFLCPRPVLVLDNLAATNLFRIAQEAARNAAVHGHAQHIEIRLRTPRGQLELQVSDDGRGLPQSQGKGKGLGLEIMRYRAANIGATFTLESQPAHGTLVSCTVKLPKPDLTATGEART